MQLKDKYPISTFSEGTQNELIALIEEERREVGGELGKVLRHIISTALNSRQDTQQVIKVSPVGGDYVQANTDTMMEIESQINKFLEELTNKI